ncbi:MAG: hypothetical protein WCO00_10530 [Rhodospirillaceae bacterium]
MGLIDCSQPSPEADAGRTAPFPAGAGHRAATLRAVVALASRLGVACPPMLVGGLLVRLAETAETDPADAEGGARAARTLVGYLAEHAIPLHALSEPGLVLGTETVRTRLQAINTDMARLEALVAALTEDSEPEPPIWQPLGLGEARLRRGVFSSAGICRRLEACLH